MNLDLSKLATAAKPVSPAPTAQPGDGVELSEEQKQAVDRIVSTDKTTTILTGPAGCGKSTIINYLRYGPGYAVCATTGKAAMHVSGVTVDNMFCFSRNNWRVWNEGYLEHVMSQAPDRIIIDEASMIGRKMGNVIHEIARDFKKQLILVGDFAQARPVKDDWITESRLMDDYNFLRLTECHRQDEGEYLSALNKVRVGQLDPEVRDLFCSRIQDEPPDDDQYIRLFATNKKTMNYNLARLWQHVALTNAANFRLFSTFTDLRPPDIQRSRPRGEDFKQKEIENSNLAHNEVFARGCRVVCTCNHSEGGTKLFVNGDTGELVDARCSDGRDVERAVKEYREKGTLFEVSHLLVRLDRTGQVVPVTRIVREGMSPLGKVSHSISGFPVRLGYAMTIHKAQGMTVPKAWVDLPSLMRFPSQESRHGLAYVALSRTTSLEGLLISGWESRAIYCDPAIRELL